MCWGGRVPFLLGLLVGETQASSLGGWVGYSREEDVVQVLESPLFISYRHHPRPLKQELAHAICTSSHCPGLCRPRGAPPWQDEHAQKWHSIFACPGLGNTANFLVSLPLCNLANPKPRHFALCPYKALKKPVPSPQDRKTCTARITYCRQMGHSFMRLPHLVQVTMWPHSSRTQSMGESMQILHRFSSRLDGTAPPVQTQGRKGTEGKVMLLFKCMKWWRDGGGREQTHCQQIPKFTHFPSKRTLRKHFPSNQFQ